MADEHRESYRQALFDYLRDRTTRDERKELIKEAIRELWEEGKSEFGWMSIKALAYGAFLALTYILLFYNGYHK